MEPSSAEPATPQSPAAAPLWARLATGTIVAVLATAFLVAIASVLGLLVYGGTGLRAGFGLWPYLLIVGLGAIWLRIIGQWWRDRRARTNTDRA